VLTEVIAPFTTKWHHQMEDWEEKRTGGVGRLEHERNWKHFQTMQEELINLQQNMRSYAEALAKIAGVQKDSRSLLPGPMMIQETPTYKLGT